TVGLAATGGAAVAARRAAGAADNAAIAAADTVSGALPGESCERAAEVAEASGARLVSCDTEDLDAIVSVGVSFAGMAAVARARAGPPRDSGVPE
ncbi:MAG: helicase, partial [Microbacterium sp.]|uniref:Rv3654c family TadE-like protein n=1 Tax=Microbacterium sp. TaxID=51671 RepID=UPI00271E1293